MNLAPTSTGSASAIALIFPELKGKLNGLAVRVPLTNSSITDCVFEVSLSSGGACPPGLLDVKVSHQVMWPPNNLLWARFDLQHMAWELFTYSPSSTASLLADSL